MKKRLLFIATALALISYGCDSSSGGGGTADMQISNPAAEAAADRAVGSTQTLTTLKAEPDSANALGAMSSMYGDLSAMGSAGTAGISGFLTQKAGLDTCVTSSDIMISYNDCDFGSSNINGNIGINGDSFSADLTVNTAAAGTGVGFRMLGTITVTSSLINGSISYDTSISGIDIPGGIGGIKLDAVYDNIGLDSAGCPVSGSLSVRQEVSGGVGFDFGEVRAEFGPGCGDVQLYN